MITTGAANLAAWAISAALASAAAAAAAAACVDEFSRLKVLLNLLTGCGITC
jgi:hypothetical protein